MRKKEMNDIIRIYGEKINRTSRDIVELRKELAKKEELLEIANRTIDEQAREINRLNCELIDANKERTTVKKTYDDLREKYGNLKLRVVKEEEKAETTARKPYKTIYDKYPDIKMRVVKEEKKEEKKPTYDGLIESILGAIDDICDLTGIDIGFIL